MRNIITFSLLAAVAFTLKAQETKKVLFIGNSYTYYNSLPNLINQLAQSKGDTLNYESRTPGGRSIKRHAEDPAVMAMINSDKWDYVIIQCQSQEPSFPLSQVQTDVFPFAKAICDSIRKNDSCTIPLFYMTWGRKYGDANNCAFFPPLCTYKGMDSMLRMRYQKMADDNQGYVAPVGPVWRNLIDSAAPFDLYTSDQSHPSLSGSFAAACAFYSVIFQKDPTLTTYNSSLSSSNASLIKAAGKRIAFDSLAVWNVNQYLPKASFTYSKTNNTFQFTNTSKFSTNFFWDFGDGNTSTSFNPSHTFADTQERTVTLTSYNCNNEDSSKSIVNTRTNIINPYAPIIKVYPNPTKSSIYINTLTEFPTVLIYDLKGVQVLKASGRNINVQELSNGVYTVQVTEGSNTRKLRWIKN